MKSKDLWSAILAAALFLVLLVGFQWNILFAAAVAVIVYFAFTFLLKPTKKIGGVDVDSIKGGEELSETIDEANDNLRQLQKAALFIRRQNLQDSALKMAESARRILRYLEKHVDQIPQVRRFMTYYLGTAAQILKRYVDFQNNGAPDSDMKRVTENTQSAVQTLNETFDSLYSRLLQGEVMNMEVDVDVLKNIAHTDIKDTDFHVETPVQGTAAVQTASAKESKEEEH